MYYLSFLSMTSAELRAYHSDRMNHKTYEIFNLIYYKQSLQMLLTIGLNYGLTIGICSVLINYHNYYLLKKEDVTWDVSEMERYRRLSKEH